MKQTINLARHIPAKTSKPLLTNSILMINAFVFVFLILITLMDKHQNNALSPFYKKLELQSQVTKVKIDRFTTAHPEIVSNENSTRRLEEIAKRVEANKKIITLLTNEHNPLSTQGFSKYFTLFAQSTNSSIQLTNIEIYDGGSSVSLTGNSLNSEALIKYMQLLNKNPLFHDNQLHLADIMKTNRKSTAQGFLLYAKNQDDT